MGTRHRLRRRVERAIARLQEQDWIDRPGYRAEHIVGLTLNLFGDAGERVRNGLHGTWAGHPVHPLLTDLPVGAWTVTLVLDGIDAVAPRPTGFRAATRTALGVGVAGALGAVATGAADWQHTHDEARRLGALHGVGNGLALALNTWSLRARGGGRIGPARRASATAYALTMVTAYLGGVLVYRRRIGVDHIDDRLEPRTFTAALPEADLAPGAPRLVEVGDVGVVLVRHGGRVHALGQHCSHLGGPMAEGWMDRGGLVCPWHGSRFDLVDGAPARGPATAPLGCFDTRIRQGMVEVRRRPSAPRAAPGSVVTHEQERHDGHH